MKKKPSKRIFFTSAIARVAPVSVVGVSNVVAVLYLSRLWPGVVAAVLRRASLVIVILLTCGAFTLLHTGGSTSKFVQDFHWRWSKTPEEPLMAQAADEQAALASAPGSAFIDSIISGSNCIALASG